MDWFRKGMPERVRLDPRTENGGSIYQAKQKTKKQKTGEVEYPKQKNRKKALRGWYTWEMGRRYKIK